MPKRKNILEKACDNIASDLEKSFRHWDYVKTNAEMMVETAGEREYVYAWQYDIATSALDVIANQKKAPVSLVLGEAAKELGVMPLNEYKTNKRTCGCPRNRVPTQAWESIDDTDADDPGMELDENGYPIGDFEDCEG